MNNRLLVAFTCAVSFEPTVLLRYQRKKRHAFKSCVNSCLVQLVNKATKYFGQVLKFILKFSRGTCGACGACGNSWHNEFKHWPFLDTCCLQEQTPFPAFVSPSVKRMSRQVKQKPEKASALAVFF